MLCCCAVELGTTQPYELALGRAAAAYRRHQPEGQGDGRDATGRRTRLAPTAVQEECHAQRRSASHAGRCGREALTLPPTEAEAPHVAPGGNRPSMGGASGSPGSCPCTGSKRLRWQRRHAPALVRSSLRRPHLPDRGAGATARHCRAYATAAAAGACQEGSPPTALLSQAPVPPVAGHGSHSHPLRLAGVVDPPAASRRCDPAARPRSRWRRPSGRRRGGRR